MARIWLGQSPAIESEGGIARRRERSVDGNTVVEFDAPSGEAATLTYGATINPIVLMGPADEAWWKRSPTDLGLARLSFRCLEPVKRRFEPTGLPPELPAERCDAERVSMGGCLAAAPNVLGEEPSSRSLDLTGIVTAAGAGLPPSDALLSDGDPQGCPFGYEDTLRFGEIYQDEADVNLVDELYWLHLEADTNDAWLVLRIPDFDPPFAMGDTVHLLHASQLDFGGAIDAHVELRDEDENLLVWLGQSYTLEELEVPAELELETGVELCSLSEECALDFGYYEIEASLGSEAGAALQGESLELNGYRFVNSAFQIQTGAFVCTDSTAYFIRMALWRE